MEKEKITALYCRISREDELNTISSSIETQKAYLKRYANQHRMSNTKYYIDDGYSGTNFKRPGFTELQSDIENNQVQIVITKDLSRLGRDYLSTGYYIEHYFPMNNVRYIAINDQVDTLLNENDFAPFRNIINEWYARDISKKIRSAYHTKALNGEFTGPYPPFGYDKDQNNKNRLVINPIQAGIIKEIFRLYISGFSVYGISKELRKDKVLTPRVDLYKRIGKYHSDLAIRYPYDWSTKTILSILCNEEYTGSVICNKHQTKTFKSKKLLQNSEDKWIISKDKHEAIIDRDQFSQVQKLIHQNQKFPKTPHENIFKGKIRCDDCGKTLTLSIRPGRKEARTYECSTYRRYGKIRCNSHYITSEWLEKSLLEKLNIFINLAKQGENFLLKGINKQKDTDSLLNDLGMVIEEKETRLHEIDKLIQALYENYILRKIHEDKFYSLDKSFDEEKKSLINEINLLQQKQDDLKKQKENVYVFLKFLSNYENLSEINQVVVNELIDKIVISRKKGTNHCRSIDVFFKYVGRI